MKIEQIKLENLKPYEKNQKLHSKKQIDLLKKNIVEFGFTTPILIDKDNEIIAGHGRLIALKELKCSDVPCVRMENLTEKQVKALRLADNKLNESDWDMNLVIEELKGLDDDLLDLTGFDKDLIIEPDDKDDEVPDVPEEPTAKLGDIYQLGNHRIMCGDSTKIEDVEKLMDGKKADLVVTDPPYNVDYEGSNGLKIENDKMDESSFLQFLIDAFSRLSEHMKAGASFYIWHADLEGYNFRKACKEAGFKIRQCIIWNKNSLVMGRQDYQWKHEPCLYGWKEGAGHSWYGERNKTTVYKIPESEVDAFKWFKRNLNIQKTRNLSVVNCEKPKANREHPTMKPIELLEKQVLNNSKQEDIVIDTFLGSGSTLIACEKTNRICYGMELDTRYIDVIIKRWEDYTENKAIKLN